MWNTATATITAHDCGMITDHRMRNGSGTVDLGGVVELARAAS